MKKKTETEMEVMVEKMEEVMKFLEKNHLAWQHTRTRALPDVLPSFQALKGLESAAKKVLETWGFYRSVMGSIRIKKRIKKLKKMKRSMRAICYGSIAELKYLESHRGRIYP